MTETLLIQLVGALISYSKSSNVSVATRLICISLHLHMMCQLAASDSPPVD